MDRRQILLARKALGWSQADLARLSYINRKTIYRMESGRSKLKDSTMAKIEKALSDAGVEFGESDTHRWISFLK